ncbi:amino acid adenylation domain-containing protein [Roseomonas hellenica]|uniref:Amino acid adenylation domain-containing protein n=1 Tax=Plastoroseomonas hellenica TaxID=2687306 RepID=A0ABS5ER26_9PROT|nr:non-ribosomal peptide synthetase/type I polyketide synthase [Plastoroseomonas hellenica]MBR0662742.1 amino acid adenylation domain-containing protein [Plastoroseomonas hellenica]
MSGEDGLGDEALDGIAIIGMAGRFPGAPDIRSFWRNLCEGRDSIARFTEAELEDSFSAAERAAPNFVRARGIVEDIERFDAAFFGMRAREAALTDPQHRVFLEICWQAFEDAGYDPARYPGAVGVFAGASMNTYFLHHVATDRAALERFTSNFQVGEYTTLVGALGDTLATRVSYKLDLRGPSMGVLTACSTSLVAAAQACQSLLLQQCDMALAGGVSITLPQRRGYFAEDGAMCATNGVCRPFDADANGTVFSSGAGVVLMKRLADAIADGDHIYAVIKGSAVNNDGAGKVGFTAPSVGPQAELVATAQAIAGFDPRSVGFIECHGTATPLGDPIEVAGLTQAFREGTQESGFCAIGSLKGNVGHMDAAAGVAGLIKAALAVESGTIPGTLHFRAPNPRLEIDGSPFFVAGTTVGWPLIPGPRRAGVSALGVGGTNAHLCLEQAPARDAVAMAAPREVLLLSARSEAGLAEARAALAARLAGPDAPALADVAHTLRIGRRAFRHRFAAAAGSHAEAVAALTAEGGLRASAPAVPRPVVFLFPGQGAQYPGMGRALFRDEPVFRAAMERCAAALRAHGGRDLLEALYGETPEDADAIRHTLLAQPAIFAVEYALAQLWLARGVTPAAMIGHSIGEFVAATLAGVMTLEAAIGLVATRGRLMEALPGGAMLAVRLPEAELLPLLADGVDLAGVNAPALCVAAGPHEAIAALEQVLEQRGAGYRRLHTSHAFHSAMMEPAVGPLAAAAAAIPFAAPTLPYVSTVTGEWITEAEALAPDYWARHARATVRFAAALQTLRARMPEAALLEVGPGQVLGTLARQGAGREAGLVVAASLPDPGAETSDLDTMAAALGRLWVSGAEIAWPARPDCRRVPLPSTPFERTRHWIDAPSSRRPATESTTVAPLPALEIPPMSDTRLATAQAGIVAAIEALSGEAMPAGETETSFLELGYDSLFLSQLAQQLRTRFSVPLSFRQLTGELCNLATLGAFVAEALPQQAAAPAPVAVPAPAAAAAAPLPTAPPALPAAAPGVPGTVEALMQDQLRAMSQLMQAQLDALRGIGTQAVAQPAAPTAVPAAAVPAPAPTPAAAPAKAAEMINRFARFRPGQQSVTSGELSPAQRAFVDALAARQNARMPGSRRLTETHRGVLADPRAASGFRKEWKELVYPVVAAAAEGARIRDVDGNSYIDLVNGYGVTALGHSPAYVVDAVAQQLRDGFPIGPQADLAGEVAAMIAEMTGNERVSFTCTGSEAVMAALRLARAVTGRKRVVSFAGAYHGGFDEVILRGVRVGGEPRALPAAAGITEEAVTNFTVLEYGDDQALEWIAAHAHELAAVLVEPVQSRHPDLQPREFLQRVRTITEQAGAALIFDEVVTGFRVHPGGAQALFGIRADLATYGKVLGGGLPIGIIAGKARFMDALDGGQWQYGDASVPEVDVTVFAGTFVRHPLALAAAKAVLLHLKQEGPALQEALSARCAALAEGLNAMLARRGIATRAERFGSMFHLSLSGEDRRAGLLPYLMRERGVHYQEGFPCFLTTAHGAAECDAVLRAFDDAIGALQGIGILGGSGEAASAAAAAPAQEIVAAAPAERPLTEPQMEVWLAAQLGDEASCAFNESVSLTLEGALDQTALRAALEAVVARHDALRARFTPDGITMRIAAPTPLDLPVEEVDLAQVLDEEAHTPFDLENGPVFRARLLRRNVGTHVLVFTAHHIVCDGWSANTVIQDLSAFYAAGRDGKPAALLPAPSFAALAVRADAPEATAAAEAYWLAQFAEVPEPLELPTDRPRPAVKSFRGATFSTSIDAGLYQAVKRAGARHGCTAFATLFAAFQLLMGRLAGQDEVVVGVPMAGQSLLEDSGLVGHCVNFLPIRGKWDATTTLAQHLAATRTAVLDAQDHQRCTFGTIVRRLALPRDPNRLPLTDVQFNLERLAEPEAFGGLRATLTPNAKAFVNFDLFFNLSEGANGLRLDIDYATDLFDTATIGRWVGHYATLLAAIAEDASVPAVRAPLLSTAERRALLADIDRPETPLPAVQGFHTLFEGKAAARPDAVAAVCGKNSWTYRELDERADFLAAHLAARIPGTEARIGVLMDRSLDMLAALLAVAKAGFTYVPLDPHHPPARLTRIIQQSDLAALFTDKASRHLAPEVPTILVGPAMLPPGQPLGLSSVPQSGDRAAYVIFTSGSTGAPKGVEVGHEALLNLLRSMAREPGFTAQDTMLAVTTIAFDIAALELFLPLITGGSVVIADRETTLDGFALLRLLEGSGATVMQATPSGWRMLLEAGFRGRPGLTLFCGGEALPRDLADRLLEGGSPLWNLYGPTETTIWSSAFRVPEQGPIVIGAPVDNTRLYVLDRHDELAPPGVVGELLIGGTGVARCYFGDPAQTAQKFVVDPFAADGGRMYRTGDRARLLPGGGIELLGRSDGQVKLRGFRIELGEIETALRRLPEVTGAAVLLRHDAGRAPRLVAYVSGTAGQAPDALREALAEVLPDYMVPSAYVTIAALPLTPNGKLDRRALPVPDAGSEVLGGRAPAVPLATDWQRQLGGIWQEVLGLDAIGAADDVLALGADSIQLFQIVARARRAGITLSAQDILRHRTIGTLSQALEGVAAPAEPTAGRRLPQLSDFRRKGRN